LRQILEDVGANQEEPTVLHSSNQSAIKLAHNPVYHARSKHIEPQHHFIKEKIESKEFDLTYCNTSNNVTDIFTKPIGCIQFEVFREVRCCRKSISPLRGNVGCNGEIVVIGLLWIFLK